MNRKYSTTRLVTLGSSDAFNHGGRANSSFWVEDEISTYLLDCGPTTPLAIQQLEDTHSLRPQELEVIYLTHLHGDHIAGLPVLLLDLNFCRQRKRPLIIAGPLFTEQRVRALCDSSYPNMLQQLLQFEIIFHEWALDSQNQIGNRKIKAVAAQHDPQAYPTSIQIQTEQSTLVFSGDTGWNDELIELSAEADAFVLECSYETSVFPGHLSLSEIEQKRHLLTPKKLILTHFSQESRKASVAKQAALNLCIADDGVEWIL